MSLWRLEWQRLLRTKRWIALLGVYVFFGLLGPFTARYLAEIVTFAGGELEGAVIELPPPVPSDGMVQYVSNVVQLGTLVAVVVAAGALAFDAAPEMGVFLRTRVPRVARILTPRVVTTGVAVVVAFLAGTVAAWYETWVLIGAPDSDAVLTGAGLSSLFLVFVVSLVAAVAGRARTVLGTVMISIVILLVMPVLGISEAIGRWLPSHLANALAALPTGDTRPSDYLAASVVTVAASAVLLWLAARLAERREL
jgi:ABC-2 type transport system permease protein